MDRVKRSVGVAWDFAREIVRQWRADRVGGLSAEIGFFALLGFLPLLIVLAAVLGSADALLGESNAAEIESWLAEQMISVFGGGNTLEATVHKLFATANTSAFTLGAVLTAYAVTRGFAAVVRALDLAYDHVHLRSWLSTRLLGFVLAILTVLVSTVVLTLIVVGPLFGEGEELASRFGVDGWFTVLWDWFRWPVVFAVMVAWAATVYHVAPNHRSPWKSELPGAVLASVWWTAVSLGFGQYLAVASSGANAVFGFLGGALSLLFWLYLMAMGLLLGAEVNSLVARRQGVLSEASRPAE